MNILEVHRIWGVPTRDAIIKFSFLDFLHVKVRIFRMQSSKDRQLCSLAQSLSKRLAVTLRPNARDAERTATGQTFRRPVTSAGRYTPELS